MKSSPLVQSDSCQTLGRDSVLTATAYDRHVEQLFDRMHQLHRILSAAGIAYRIVGGLAVYLHVAERDLIQARLTPDVDAAIHRQDLLALLAAAQSADFALAPQSDPPQSPIKLYFLDEMGKLALPPAITAAGIPIARVEDLLDTKLTTYRLKDKVHIQDLDNVGLITPEIESTLAPLLLARLREIRATE